MDLPAMLRAELARLDCEYAFYYRRRDEEPVLIKNQERFVSASIIKIPILMAWVALERAGRANRDEIAELDLEPEVQGAGLAWLMHTRRLPYHDVLLLMTALSDNFCANLVIQRLGITRLNSLFRSHLGLKDTVLGRKMMDFAAREAGRENYVSVSDCIQLYRLRDEWSAAEREWVEPMLRANPDTCLWLRDLPPDTITIQHKGGTLDGVLHEWAYAANQDLFLLTQKVTNYDAVYRAFGSIGAMLLK